MIDKPTGARPRIIDGVTFRCYRTGILRYEWRSDDGRLIARDRHEHSSTYVASVDGKHLTTGDNLKRFRSMDGAMKAAVAALKSAERSET